jgi:hypothetical protein
MRAEEMGFKEFLPTSCEVFVIPLVCAYLTFLVGLPTSPTRGALVFPGIWLVLVSLFAIGDYFGDKDHWLLIKRMLLILGCLLPMALIGFLAGIMGLWNMV